MFAFQSSAENSAVVCEDLDAAFAQMIPRTAESGLDEVEFRWDPAGISEVRLVSGETQFTMTRMEKAQ